MDCWIKIDEKGNILSALKLSEELASQDLIPITDLEYKFLRRYGLDLRPVREARFARSLDKKIRKYLYGEDKDE